ncbi:GNAT family N-acetyltransferase [Paenibacillus sp. J2TS4]|uniref:GNAT family N-acetyltransferase n=1 Tax=Paenibacillus sp. J2TS4 TaxID=2807194 RepID=UPI001B064451|nr:GNAT family protein [Paenibacillus sp. J2TS4]GIP32704.1 N-acetyltransferase [Paenibacillus sp. J2TS4]
MLSDIILTGSRVKLMPLDLSHVAPLFSAGQDPNIWTYLPHNVRTLNDMEVLVQEALKEKESGIQYPFTVIDLQSNRIIGSTRLLNLSESNRNVEIGWTWYSSAVWRTCVNTECKYLLLQYCFEELNLVRVQFKADVRNERSNKAINRIGAVHEGTMRLDRILPDGYIRSSNLYSIINTEWNSIKHKFEKELLRGI